MHEFSAMFYSCIRGYILKITKKCECDIFIVLESLLYFIMTPPTLFKMKHLILVLSILSCIQCFAQDPQLLENTWHFTSGQLDGESLELDFPDFENDLIFDTTSIWINYPFCEETNEGSVDYGTSSTAFDLIGGTGGLVGTCTFPFMIKHLAIYHQEDGTPKNPFSYSIEDQGSYLQLTVINGNGDIAVYANQYLGINEEKLINITISPNPTSDIVHFTTINNQILSVAIYTLNGKLTNHFIKGKKSLNEFSVAHLTAGVYFLKINTEKGQTTKKIVKH